MAFSSAQSTTVERLLSENNNKLKQGFHNLCCKLDTLTPPTKDYEPVIGYNPTTGELVISTYGYNADGTFTISNTNPDGTPYTGPTPIRGEKDFELSTKEWFCVNNTDSVSRVDIFIDGILTSSIWQSLDGTIIPAPTSGNYTPGICNTSIQSYPLRDVTFDNLVTNYQTNPGTTNLVQESAQVIADSVANVAVGPEYTQTVRIVSDSKDIVRTEVVNIVSEVTPVCFTRIIGGNREQGFLITEKDHLGSIINSWITDSGAASTGGAIDNINDGISGATIVPCTDVYSNYNRTIIPCAVIFDTTKPSGFSFVKNGHLLEDVSFGTLNASLGTIFTFPDGITNTTAVGINGTAFLIDCPKLICIQQNGIISKAYKVDASSGITSIQGTITTYFVTYFDENYESIDDTIFPITEVACSQENYNNIKHEETSSTPIIIPANTVHSISYKILSGVVDITIGTNTLSYQAGEADTEEATTLINQQYTFTPDPVGGVVKIKTIF